MPAIQQDDYCFFGTREFYRFCVGRGAGAGGLGFFEEHVAVCVNELMRCVHWPGGARLFLLWGGRCPGSFAGAG